MHSTRRNNTFQQEDISVICQPNQEAETETGTCHSKLLSEICKTERSSLFYKKA